MGLPRHETVRHTKGSTVNEMVHSHGMESFWSMGRRGYCWGYRIKGPLHPQGHVSEWTGPHTESVISP